MRNRPEAVWRKATKSAEKSKSFKSSRERRGYIVGIGKKRPLACLCWLIVLLMAWYCFAGMSGATALILLIVGVLLTAFLMAITVFHRAEWLAYACVLSCCLWLVGGAVLVHETLVWKPARNLILSCESREDNSAVVEGVVIERGYDSPYLTTFLVLLENSDTAHIRAYLSCNYESNLQVGNRFCMEASVCAVDEMESDTDRIRYWKSEGVVLCLTSETEEKVEVLGHDVKNLRIFFANCQRRCSAFLRRFVPGEEGKLASALLLGNRDILSGDTTLWFRRAGVAHILALSGLHVSLMMGLLSFLLLHVPCPFRVRLTVVSLCALFYLGLTGCSMSALRATMMLIYLNIGGLLGVENDPITSLSVFLAGCLLCWPEAIYSSSLWLSVIATLAITEVAPAVTRNVLKEKWRTVFRMRTDESQKRERIRGRLLRPVRNIIRGILGSIIVLVFLIIPQSLLFGELSLLSPVFTLLLTPMVAWIIVVGMLLLPIALLTGWFMLPTTLCECLGVAIRYPAGWMLSLTRNANDWRGTVISLRYDFLKWLLPLLGVAILLFLIPKWKKPSRFWYIPLGFGMTFAVCMVVSLASMRGTTNGIYQTVGKNEVLCFSDANGTVLCDMTDGGFSAYSEFLNEGLPDHATSIDALVLTHYHNRHISTVTKLMQRIRVWNIWLPLTADPSVAGEKKAEQDWGILRSIVDVAEARHVTVHFYRPNDGAPITESVHLDLLFYRMLKRSTHPVLEVSWRIGASQEEGKSLCWMGASLSECPDTTAIVDDIARADTIIVGQHGPIYKTPVTLLQWAQAPDAVVLSSENILPYISEDIMNRESFRDSRFRFANPDVCFSLPWRNTSSAALAP